MTDDEEASEFPVGRGWWPILRELVETLTEISPTFDPADLRVKEKFGYLRASATPGSPDDDAEAFHAACRAAEEASESVCESCGAQGDSACVARDFRFHWVANRCAACRDRKSAEEAAYRDRPVWPDLEGAWKAGWRPILNQLRWDLDRSGRDLTIFRVWSTGGQLEIGWHVADPAIRDAVAERIAQAQEEAAQTCQRCGEPGEQRWGGHDDSRYGVGTLCDECETFRAETTEMMNRDSRPLYGTSVRIEPDELAFTETAGGELAPAAYPEHTDVQAVHLASGEIRWIRVDTAVPEDATPLGRPVPASVIKADTGGAR